MGWYGGSGARLVFFSNEIEVSPMNFGIQTNQVAGFFCQRAIVEMRI